MPGEVYSHPDDARELAAARAFHVVWQVAVGRLQEAIEAQRDNPDYRHFLLESRPETGLLVAVFALASRYNDVRGGQAESFDIGVPVFEPDIHAPHPVPFERGGDVLSLDYTVDGEVRSLIIDQPTFRERFFDQPNPPIVDLEEKLATYQIIPTTKPLF